MILFICGFVCGIMLMVGIAVLGAYEASKYTHESNHKNVTKKQRWSSAEE